MLFMMGIVFTTGMINQKYYNEKWCSYYVGLMDTIDGLLKAIEDWERLDSDPSVDRSLEAAGLKIVQSVYMSYIGIEMYKVLSTSKQDKIRMVRIKDFIRDLELVEDKKIADSMEAVLRRMENFLGENKDNKRNKWKSNRHGIWAHRDIGDKALVHGLSQRSADELSNWYVSQRARKLPETAHAQLENIQAQAEKLRQDSIATSVDKERYTKEDFRHDLPVIKEWLEDVMRLLNDVDEEIWSRLFVSKIA